MASTPIPKQPQALCDAIKHLSEEWEQSDSGLMMDLKPLGKRSMPQNALLWLWLGEIASQVHKRIGESHEAETLHEFFKEKFLPTKTIRVGKAEVNYKSTRKLDKGEMNHYMTQVHQWAVNAGFKLTVPINSQYREIMERQNV